MLERLISEEDVRWVLRTGETIREYADDKPLPSRLVLGFHQGRPIHVVAADDKENQQTIVITAYEPDLERWEPDFKTRKRRTP